MSNAQKEYIITLKNYDDLDQFYTDMEGNSSLPYLPTRSVTCVAKRPISRNTHYLLTDSEARNLKNDPRVYSVNVKIKDLSAKTNSEQTSTWSRSFTTEVDQKNYALYRCRLDDNIIDWGSESGNNFQNATIKVTSTGKNVDVIILDETLYPEHYEYQNRFVNHDWFGEHDIAVKGAGTTITFVERTSNLATITTQIPHGLEAGSFVDVVCTSDLSFSGSNLEITDTPSSTTFTYSNTGTDVSSTSATGYWKGLYQYGDYSYDNNHATHVAGIIAGITQGWARESNIYNLRHNSDFISPGSYIPPELLIDYIREFHATKSVNPQTGRKNPTLVNCSWGFGTDVANLNNPYTGFQSPRFSRLNYRGSFITPAAAAIDTGFSGVFESNTKRADFTSVLEPGLGNRITTDPDTVSGDPTFCQTSSITFSDTNKLGLSDIGVPTSFDSEGIDSQDDAYWNISLPFPVKYLTQSYNNVYVNSNSYITFGNANFTYVMGDQSPALRKICISAGDRNCDAVYTGTFGTVGSRTFIIRWEGYDGAYGGVYELSPNMIWEMTFYEATPEQIDVHVISNACYRSEFTTSELSDYGINLNGPAAPLREATIDTDIADAISEGIIFVGSAGNSSTKIDNSSGDDYNNYFIDNGLPVYYHRGATPGASSTVICVGNADSNSQENKSPTSNTGPRVDLYAPGNNVISSVYDSTSSPNTVGLFELTIEGGGAGTASLITQQAGLATLTATNHGLSNGDLITVEDCTNSKYNVINATVTVYDADTIIYTMQNDPSYNNGLELLEGTIKAKGLYQKISGTSMAAAQVTGILALALETYPWMTQEDARNYILSYAKQNVMFDTTGGYLDNISLQNGNNKFAYYHRERPDDGVLLPKYRQWIRPISGVVFPRAQIKKN